MSYIDDRKALTREKRVSTLSHYNGTLETLADDVKGAEIKQRIRTFTQSCDDEIIYAFKVLSKIEDSVIIVHGSAGCSASGIHFNQEKNIHWYSTNLNERDTILGGDDKLRKAILRAYEEKHPKAIFVVGTPVVAINNDDINAVILELEEELDVHIISIYTDGFKTKTPATGYDIVLHSLLRYVLDRSAGGEEKEDFVNVVSVSEKKEDIVAVTSILKDLDISYQVLPQYSSIDNIKRAGKAKATIVLNPDEGSYFAQELEEVFGVTYIKTEVPIGLRGTRNFIKKIGKALSIEQKASEYINTQEEILEKYVNKEPLAGRHVFLDITLAAAVNFVNFIEQLGGSVDGLAIFYVDLNNSRLLEKMDSLKKGTPVIVANGQPFEKANVISKKEIDFYIGLDGNVGFAAEQGVVPIVHANAGCAIQNYLANQASGVGNGYVNGYSIPGTDSQERHIIFGGGSRLREQIKNTVKVVNGDLYIVLNSCESAMVGDDVDAMNREAAEQGEPVIDSLTAGFHGDSHYGYECVVSDILRKLPAIRKSGEEKEADLVNIFGILPKKDIYFKGDLAEVKRILQGIGLKVNTFFGPQNGIEEFVKAPNASLNLVFSSIPTGIKEVKEFVRTLSKAISLDEEQVHRFLEKEEEVFYYYFRGIVDSYYEDNVGKIVGIVGDESTVIRTAAFLKEYLGAIVETAVITDFFPSDELPRDKKAEELSGLAEELYFTQDGKEIRNILNHSEAELILGSSLEDQITNKREIPNLKISYPVYGRTILNKTYAGIQGAFTFTEDYISKVKESNQLRKNRIQI